MRDISSQQVWIGNDLYTIEYPSEIKFSLKTVEPDAPQVPEAPPVPEAPNVPAEDEWEERRGMFYTLVQIIFAYLMLTQGASTLKSIIIAVLLLITGLSQLGYISWSNWLVNAARIVQPGQVEQEQPLWKTVFLLSINFILSLFPGLNEIQ